MVYFGVKAVILGDFLLKEPICSYSNGYKVSIFLEDGIYKISLIKIIPNESPLQIRYRISNDTSSIVIPDDADYQDYIKQLQIIESLGGFNYGINKVLYHETMELTWYIGKEVFRDLSIIYSVKKEYNLPNKKILSQSCLSSILLLKRLIPDSIIPYNYYREAYEYFQNEQYRQAYLHFYMLLEFCFSNGKTRKNDQVESFENNIELIFAILDTLNTLYEHNIEIYNWIHSKLQSDDKEISLNNILKLLFDYRGMLAHGIKRSAKYVFDEKSLRPITIFIWQICFMVCGNMQVYCMSSKEITEKRLKERISNLKSKLSLQL